MSEVKVNKLTPRTNCGTVTLGDSGDSFTIPAGVTITNNGTQVGFGRTGAVDWQTGDIKTTTFTPTSGEGYFVDTSSGTVTANLPAGTAGAIVAFADYTRTFATNKLTISPNGSDKIGGIAQDAILSSDGQAATFVFVDSTEGWINVQETSNSETGVPPLIKATGGTITEDGNFRIHTFTGPGTFTVTCVATEPPAPEHNIVSYVIAAGGGSGGGTGSSIHMGGGGGAGGYREVKNSPIDSYTASPKDGFPTPGNRVTVTAQAYPIVVGAGGTHPGTGPQRGGVGNTSSFAGIASAGGGGGGSLGTPGGGNPCRSAGDGGSGGGGSSQVAGSGGNGNSPPTTPPQGNNGAQGVDSPPDVRGGGGGGATAVGTQGTPVAVPGVGGAGATTNITGSPVGYSGGGSAGGTSAGGPGTSSPSPCGSGAAGGNCGQAGNSGAANLAGGGGGAGASPSNPANQLGGNGGSGVVIIRYKFQ